MQFSVKKTLAHVVAMLALTSNLSAAPKQDATEQGIQPRTEQYMYAYREIPKDRGFFFYGKLAYAAYLTIGLGAARWHYKNQHAPRMDNELPNQIVMQHFAATIDGLEREITILGESHSYNRREKDFVEQLVPQYDHVLLEGDRSFDPKEASLSTILAALCVAPLVLMQNKTTRRTYTVDPDVLASNAGMSFEYMEKSTQGGLDLIPWYRRNLVSPALYLLGLVTLPNTYFATVKAEYQSPERIIDGTKNQSPMMRLGGKIYAGHARQESMIAEALDSLHNVKTRRILVPIGRGHFPGFVEKLGKQVELTPTSEMYVAENEVLCQATS